MGTIQGFADVAIRIGVVMLGTKYFGFWGVAFGDGATWMIGAIILCLLLNTEKFTNSTDLKCYKNGEQLSFESGSCFFVIILCHNPSVLATPIQLPLLHQEPFFYIPCGFTGVSKGV